MAKTESWDLFYPPTTEIVRRGTNPRGERPEAKKLQPLRDPARELRIVQYTRPRRCPFRQQPRPAPTFPSLPDSSAPVSSDTLALRSLRTVARRRCRRGLSLRTVARPRALCLVRQLPRPRHLSLQTAPQPLMRVDKTPASPATTTPAFSPAPSVDDTIHLHRPTSGRGSSRARCSSSAGSCGCPAPSRTATRSCAPADSCARFADLEGTAEPAINDLVHSIEALAPTPTSRPPTLTTTPFRHRPAAHRHLGRVRPRSCSDRRQPPAPIPRRRRADGGRPLRRIVGAAEFVPHRTDSCRGIRRSPTMPELTASKERSIFLARQPPRSFFVLRPVGGRDARLPRSA